MRLCGTVSCTEIEDDSHEKSLDVFSYLKVPKHGISPLYYKIDPLFAYDGTITVQDTGTIPCMVFDPTVKISLHLLYGER
jgi:hypothetical protein